MRIALFTETYLPDVNGVAAHIYTLKVGLEALGHDVLVVAADKYARRHYVLDGVLHCPSLEAKKLYGFGIAPPTSHRRLKFIKEFNPDIIHIHHEFGIGLSGISAAKHLNIPVVYTLHTMYDMYIHYIAPQLLTKVATKISHKYEHYVAKRSTILASPSKKGEAYFRQIGAGNKEFHLIPNSADLEAFRPECITMHEQYELRGRLCIHPETSIACFVGRLGEEKNVDLLLRYWKESISPEDKLHLLIIGDGPSRSDLEALAKELNIEDMITFTGKIEHKYVPNYYAISDIFITASLSEMNSISMLEGMASGLPTLQYYDELNKDQIDVGVNGYHFHNADDMAYYLKKYASLNQSEKKSLKKKVRESVANRNSEGLAEYILTIYERALLKKSQDSVYVK